MVSLNNRNNGFPSDCWLCSKFPWITWHIADSTLSITYNPNLLSIVQNNAELVIFGCLFTLVVFLCSHLWCKFPRTPRIHIWANNFLIIPLLLDDFYLSILCSMQSITSDFVFLIFLTKWDSFILQNFRHVFAACSRKAFSITKTF